MLRGDNLICGTTSTGTTTPLLLSATPVPPGGVDFDVFARATGLGFGNNAAIVVSYTIIEYTNNTFTTAKQHEKGTGTLTLGSSSGIANAQLARTTLQTKAVSMDTQPATQTIIPATAISIGNALNTLVFIGPSATEIPAFSPYVNNTVGDAIGFCPPGSPGTATGAFVLQTGRFYYVNFVWFIPMLVKVATLQMSIAFSGTSSNAWARLYMTNTSGLPGKLLYDFGLVGATGASLNATTPTATPGGGNGYYMIPGDYWFCLGVVLVGQATAPQSRDMGLGIISPGRLGRAASTIGYGSFAGSLAVGTPSATPDDLAITTSINPSGGVVFFSLS